MLLWLILLEVWLFVYFCRASRGHLCDRAQHLFECETARLRQCTSSLHMWDHYSLLRRVIHHRGSGSRVSRRQPQRNVSDCSQIEFRRGRGTASPFSSHRATEYQRPQPVIPTCVCGLEAVTRITSQVLAHTLLTARQDSSPLNQSVCALPLEEK